jgi:hypothetical protein
LGIGATNVRFTGCTAGPCPKCGGTGTIPDASYDFLDGVVNAAPLHSLSEFQLRQIIDALEYSDIASLPAEELRRHIIEVVPEIGEKLVPPGISRSDLLALIGIILMFVQVLLALLHGSSPTSITYNDYRRASELRETPKPVIKEEPLPKHRRKNRP